MLLSSFYSINLQDSNYWHVFKCSAENIVDPDQLASIKQDISGFSMSRVYSGD